MTTGCESERVQLAAPAQRTAFATALAMLLAFASSTVRADATSPARALTVSALDVEKGLPVVGAEVIIKHGDRALATSVTDQSGVAVFAELPWPPAGREGGALHLEVMHDDYQLARVPLEDIARQPVVRVLLAPVEAIVVTARAYATVARPATTLRGLELHESLRSSVPETVERVPGVAVAYNGPGAARPTIRGLGGDRVLMLEDGFRSGDLYWSASDHGVMAEPLTARRIEVVRGPATLVHGSNALGGVVNVVRDDVPKHTHSVATTVAVQGESASEGIAQGGTVIVPIGDVAVRLEESVRRSGDVQTPRGEIANTGMEALGGSAGIGLHPLWGELGASVRYYQNHYGVPGEFDGQLIPGGHPGGAAIEARRFNGRLRASYLPTPSDVFESLELGASFTRYLHDEIEGVIDGRRALGAAFELDTLQTSFLVRHRIHAVGASVSGATGATLLTQDLSAGGNSPGMRSGADWGLAGFAFERLDLAALSFHAGVRYEHRRLFSHDLDPIRLRTTERAIEKDVMARRFHLFSGSLSAMWQFVEGWTLGTTVARSSRAPNLQELYSDGPHLADFSFDIGTPGLSSEVGTGVDVFLIAEEGPFKLEATGFVNVVDDYVHYAPTLETIRVFREGARPRDTPVFEARGQDALFVGAEGTMDVSIGWGFSVESTLSYVRAERRSDSDPLPFIAPLHGQATLRYELEGFFATVSVSGAARQSRVPRPVATAEGLERAQEPTDGYALAHASAGWSGEWLGMAHTVMARGFNLTNRLWREHLSRIKEVAPQTGLNLTLTYQLQY